MARASVWATEEDICNHALVLLGEGTIDDLDSTSDPRAISLNVLFDNELANLLTMHDWKFANVIEELTVSIVGDPYTQFDYVYDLPSGMLRMIGLVHYTSTNPTYEDAPYEPFELKKDKLCTNASPCWIRYTNQISDVTDFPSWFGLAFVYRLAAVMATRLTENPNKAGYFEQQSAAQYAIAMRMDEVEGKQYQIGETRIEDVG